MPYRKAVVQVVGELKQKVSKGVVWAFLEKFCTTGVSFLVTLVLARLLTPADYGTVALLAIFIAIANALADCGFGQALVQKKDATDVDFNSVFYASVTLAVVLYLVLFVSAPAIARFYSTQQLVAILRVMSVTLIFNAINSVQTAELNRALLFNLSFRINLVQSASSAIAGISFALCGYGSWALVWSQVIGGFAGMMARWFVIKWRPKLMFSWQSLRGLFSFGWKMTVSTVLNSAMNNLSGALIGKIYTKADLAFVEKGQSLPFTGMSVVNGTVEKVSFPALAKLQDQADRVREGMRAMIKCITFLVFPLMIGCAVCAPRIVPLLYGDQWVAAIPYMQVACFTAALWPFHTLNLQAIAALGRSDIFLKLEIVKKVLAIIIIMFAIRLGVFPFVLISALVSSPLSLLINSWPNRKLLGYSIKRQLQDVLPNLAAALLMGVICFFVGLLPGWFNINLDKVLLDLITVLVQIAIGVVVYVLLAIAFRMKALALCFGMLPFSIRNKFPLSSLGFAK